MDTQQLLCPSDAAAVLVLTSAQVRTLVRKRQLAFVELPNGEIRFDAADLLAWIDSHKQSAKEATPCQQ